MGVGVVEDQALRVLCKAGGLLVDGPEEAVLVDLDAEASGCEFGAVLEGFGVGLGGFLDVGEVSLKAHALPAGSLEVLCGADKSAGPAADGVAEGVEVASGLWREEDEGLLGLIGNGNEYALFARLAAPGFDAGKPLRRGRVGGAAQEGDDQDEVSGLALGKVGMNPKAVAGKQIGRLRDGQSDRAALDVHVDLGSSEIECRALGVQCGGSQAAKQRQQKLQTTAHMIYCTKLRGGGKRDRAVTFQYAVVQGGENPVH